MDLQRPKETPIPKVKPSFPLINFSNSSTENLKNNTGMNNERTIASSQSPNVFARLLLTLIAYLSFIHRVPMSTSCTLFTFSTIGNPKNVRPLRRQKAEHATDQWRSVFARYHSRGARPNRIRIARRRTTGLPHGPTTPVEYSFGRGLFARCRVRISTAYVKTSNRVWGGDFPERFVFETSISSHVVLRRKTKIVYDDTSSEVFPTFPNDRRPTRYRRSILPPGARGPSSPSIIGIFF